MNAPETLIRCLGQRGLVDLDGVDGHEARWCGDGRDGRPDGLDPVVLRRQDDEGDGHVGEEEGGDEEEAVELEVGKYDCEGNNSAKSCTDSDPDTKFHLFQRQTN